jgi:hypothetical protein
MHRFMQLLAVAALTASAHAGIPALYIYGDVSEEGAIPSGDKQPFHQMRLNDTGRLGMSEFKEAIEDVGFDLTEQYDAALELNAAFLKNYRVIILGSNQRMFSKAEASAVENWVHQGGGLIAWSDSAFGGHYRKVGIDNTLGRDSNNRITEPFGMYFLTDSGGGNYLISEYTEDHYLNNDDRNGGVRYRGEGVSCVRISPPARMLAPLQGGGLGGKLSVNKVDAPYQPERDAALAIAEPGKGRVVGIFDRNCFWNAGDGTRLSHVDNREFVQRVVVWAAGEEKAIKVSGKKRAQGSAPNKPPVLSVEESLTVTALQADLIATIADDGQLHRFPEVRWNMVRGPATVRFENDNPNTPAVRVFFEKPGSYLMQCTVDDGEFSIQKRIKISVNP